MKLKVRISAPMPTETPQTPVKEPLSPLFAATTLTPKPQLKTTELGKGQHFIRYLTDYVNGSIIAETGTGYILTENQYATPESQRVFNDGTFVNPFFSPKVDAFTSSPSINLKVIRRGKYPTL
jgi:hypothetical protein